MDAESFSSGNARSRPQSARFGDGVVDVVSNIRCNYCVFAREATSWTSRNPARRFLGCPNFRDASRWCNFFRWIDPELDIVYYKRKLYLVHQAPLSSQDEATTNAQTLEISKRKVKEMRRLLVWVITVSLIVMVFLLVFIFKKA